MNSKIFGLTAVVLCALTAAFAGDTQPDGKDIRLPVGPEVDVDDLSASMDGKLLVYKVTDRNVSPRKETVWAFKPESGETVNLSEPVKSDNENLYIKSTLVSDDGLNIAIICRNEKKGGTIVFGFDMKTRKFAKAMDWSDFTICKWVGRRLYMSGEEEIPDTAATQPDVKKHVFGKIRYYDADSGKLSSMDACGLAVGGSAEGKYLLALCDPDNLTTPFRNKEARKKWFVRLSMDGKILEKISPAENIAGYPAVSTDGKYIAYCFGIPDGDKTKPCLKLMDVESGKDVFAIEEELWVTAVSNNGDVLALGMKMQEHKHVFFVKCFNRNGKETAALESISPDMVSLNSFFYLEKTDDGNEHPWVIKKLGSDSPAAVQSGDKNKDAFQDIKLPKGIVPEQTILNVFSDHRFMLYHVWGDGWGRTSNVDVAIYDTKKKELWKLSEKFPELFKNSYPVSTRMSHKVNKAIIVFTPRDPNVVDDTPPMLLDLDNGTCSGLHKAEGFTIGNVVWAGDKLVCDMIKDQEDRSNLKPAAVLMDASGNNPKELNIPGAPVGASANGDVILMLTWYDSRFRQLSSKSGWPQYMFFNAKGEFISCFTNVVSTMKQEPVLSPSGKYLACLSTPEKDEPEGVNVWSVDLKTRVPLDCKGFAIAVTDEGEALTVEEIKPESRIFTMKIWSKDGKTSTALAEKVVSCPVVVGDTIFFIQPGDEPVVKAVKFRKPETAEK